MIEVFSLFVLVFPNFLVVFVQKFLVEHFLNVKNVKEERKFDI